MSSVNFLTTSPASLHALSELCEWADAISLAYAWATSGAGQAKHWKALPLSKVERALIGIQFAQTEPAALRAFLERRPGVLKIVEDTSGVFHPKLIIGRKGRLARVMLGSSNFTSGGFGGNTELNALVNGYIDEPPLASIEAYFAGLWHHPRAMEPDEAWLRRYEIAYERRPRPKPLPGSSSADCAAAVTDEASIRLDWDDYYHLIECQERRSLSNGYKIHLFDHPEGSYLQEIEECQAIFRRAPSLSLMRMEDRKFVAGFGGTSGYFGRMGGAGYYKNMIMERPDEIGTFLDKVALDGPVPDELVMRYLDGAIAIRGVNVGTATRLLVAKRPDLFLSVNGASKSKIAGVFGRAPRTSAAYLALLKRIWAAPWFATPEPENEHERSVWRARVAILDAVMYDAK